MIEFLRKLHEHNIELIIDKASTSGTVMKFTMRSECLALVRYMDCDTRLMFATDEDMMVRKALEQFLSEFLEEIARRKALAERVVTDGGEK